LIFFYFTSQGVPETTTTTYYSTVSTTPTTMTTEPTTTVSPYSYLPTAKLTSTYCIPGGPGVYNVGESGTADGPVGTWLSVAWVTPEGGWTFDNVTCGSWTLDKNLGECVRTSAQPNSTVWSASTTSASGYYYGVSSDTEVYFHYRVEYGAFHILVNSSAVTCH